MPLYEIHILVSPQNELLLQQYVAQNLENLKKNGAIRPRKMTTVTSVGINLRQPMLTFLIQRKTFNEAVEVMKEVSNNMTNSNLHIVRQKVEGSQSDPAMPNSVSEYEYYEFHTKITNITDKDSWKKLAKLCLPLRVPLLYNADSNKVRPVTTLRCYDMTYQDAVSEQETLEQLLKDNGYTLEATDKEYSLYDSNVWTDQGWMFVNDPKVFICHSDDPEAYQAPKGFSKQVIVF